MKEKFKLMNTKEKMVSCQGNKHVIRLSSGANGKRRALVSYGGTDSFSR